MSNDVSSAINLLPAYFKNPDANNKNFGKEELY